jgi:hypothetical protein
MELYLHSPISLHDVVLNHQGLNVYLIVGMGSDSVHVELDHQRVHFHPPPPQMIQISGGMILTGENEGL